MGAGVRRGVELLFGLDLRFRHVRAILGQRFERLTLSAVSHDWRSRTRVTFGRLRRVPRKQRHGVKHPRRFQVQLMPRHQAHHNAETQATEGA